MDIREARYVYRLLPVDRRRRYVIPKLGVPGYLCSHFGLNLGSIDLDVYLLVLACGTSSISENLSRGQLLRFAPCGRNCACWSIFLSEGIGSYTSSVSPFPSALALLIRVFKLKRCAGFSVRDQTLCSSRNMILVGILQPMNNRKPL